MQRRAGGFGLRRRAGAGGHQRPCRRGESNGNTQVVLGSNAYSATPVLFDPDFDLAVLRTDAPLGPALTISPNLVPRGTQAAFLGYPEDGALTIGACRA